jgi:hypothetical protein
VYLLGTLLVLAVCIFILLGLEILREKGEGEGDEREDTEDWEGGEKSGIVIGSDESGELGEKERMEG